MLVFSVGLFHLLVICLSSLTTCFAQIPGPLQPVPRSQTYQGRDSDGTYSFGYTVNEPSGTTKFRQESGDGAGNRQGSYGLEEKDSQRIVFNYATKPKSSSQYINHPVSLTTQHNDQGPMILSPVPSSSSGSSSNQGSMEGSVDGFQPSFESRGHEMEDYNRFNNPAFDEDFDFEGRKFGNPRMRQSSNTHWDGGDSVNGGQGASGSGPWNKQGNGGEHNGHHHHSQSQPQSHSHPHSHHHHQPGGEPDQRGEEFGMGENREITSEPGNYDRLVAYLANQRPNGPPLPPPPPPAHHRQPMRPEDFAYKSR